jgi:tetratricopeptide (TPR) repeat protein
MWSVKTINNALIEALKQIRDGDWLELADSLLSTFPLVTDAFLAGERRSKKRAARVITLVLSWGVEELKPEGERSWLSSRWRNYNVLHGYYFEEMRVADLAETLSIADQTFYDWRQQAILTLSRVLHDGLQSSEQAERCWQFVVNGRYANLDPPSQTLLRLLSLVDDAHDLPVAWLQQPLIIQPIAPIVDQLSHTQLIAYDSKVQAVQIHPEIRSWLQGQLSQTERIAWGRGLAAQYETVGDYIASSTHYLQAGDVHQAAQLLVRNEQSIFDQKQGRAVQALIAQLPKFEFEGAPNLWAQLKLIEGRAAEFLEDTETAVRAYGQALLAPDLLVKAEAYYARAKAFQRLNLDECLGHYTVCIGLLEREFDEDGPLELRQLWTHIMIDRAWIYIQEQPDYERAATDLAQARTIIPRRDSALWSDLYNAEASLAYRQDALTEAIEKRQMAWISASESGQIELMMKTAYNLGTDYIWNQQYKSGLAYLEKAIDLAHETNNIHVEGSAQKGIGNASALMGEWETAVSHYLIAYELFHEIRHLNFLTSLCIDLVEAYAELSQYDQARFYFSEARQLSREIGQAQEIGHERYETVLNTWRERYPQLIVDLNDRQQKIVEFVQANDGIKRSQLMNLAQISKSQAHRDLEVLCKADILERVGQGRATKYILKNAFEI